MTRMRAFPEDEVTASKQANIAKLDSLQDQLDDLRNRLMEHPSAAPADKAALGQIAQEIVLLRQRRAAVFGNSDLFGEPAWEIFLTLYSAHEAQQKLSVTGVCEEARLPLATGLRWIDKLEKEGWVYRAADPVDRRRSWLNLTERALNVMRDYLAGLSLRSSQGLDFP
jgi:MarR family transcriptional regulator, temperature-dependent positive regulator of motility